MAGVLQTHSCYISFVFPLIIPFIVIKHFSSISSRECAVHVLVERKKIFETSDIIWCRCRMSPFYYIIIAIPCTGE